MIFMFHFVQRWFSRCFNTDFFSFFNLTNKLLISINHSFIYSIIRTHAYVHVFANTAKYVDAGSNTTPSSIIKRSTQNNIYNGTIYPLETFLQTNENERFFLYWNKDHVTLIILYFIRNQLLWCQYFWEKKKLNCVVKILIAWFPC